MIELTIENFDEFNKKEFAVIDFWQETCPECIALKPKIAEIERNFEKIAFYSIDCKQNKSLALKFKVFTLPTVLFFINGNLVEKLQKENCTITKIKQVLNEKY